MRHAKSLLSSVGTLLGLVLFFIGCNSSSNSPAVRSYNATASVGDFLTISVDSNAHTIAYDNLTNGESGTVPYTVNSDSSYTISDPNGNLLSAYEVPGYVMVVEAANAGPNRDTSALITAIESVPVTLQSFEGRSFNYMQFRTNNGGVEIGTGKIDSSGNMTSSFYDPGAIMSMPPNYFGGEPRLPPIRRKVLRATS